MSLKEEMIESLSKPEAIYTKFTLNYRNLSNTIHCFYEGQDDPLYYEPRIEIYTNYKYDKVKKYICNNKNSLLTVYKKIKEENISFSDNSRIAYFVDNDYSMNNILDKCIYITNTYSIENYYCSKSSIEHTIKTLFSISDFEENEISNIMKLYDEKYCEFNKLNLSLNGFLYSIRQYEKRNKIEKRTNFQKINSQILFDNKDFDNFKVKFFEKEFYEKLLDLKFEIADEILIENNKFFSSINCNQIGRGKIEFIFAKWFLDKIYLSLKNGLNGFKARNMYRIDLHNNPIFTLQRFADTPECLKTFLKNYALDQSDNELERKSENVIDINDTVQC